MIASGKEIAKKLEAEIAAVLARGPKKRVCFMQFGSDAGSRQFIALKSRVAERIGITVDICEYEAETTTEEAVQRVRDVVEKKGEDAYAGIVVQLPLPKQIEVRQVLDAVPSDMDIDVLSDAAKESFKHSKTALMPPVARAVKEILDFYGVSLEHKKVVVIGRGKLVGEPVSMMFERDHVEHDVVDTATELELRERLIKSADIVISGTGTPHAIKPDMLKPGVVVIDAGTSEQANKLVGDIDPACAEVASLLTPVPGGLGPVTVACLFANLV